MPWIVYLFVGRHRAKPEVTLTGLSGFWQWIDRKAIVFLRNYIAKSSRIQVGVLHPSRSTSCKPATKRSDEYVGARSVRGMSSRVSPGRSTGMHDSQPWTVPLNSVSFVPNSLVYKAPGTAVCVGRSMRTCV